MTNPRRHPLWSKFAEWVEAQSKGPYPHLALQLDDPTDWLDFWSCFLAGAKAGGRDMEKDSDAQASVDSGSP